ncbi:hypothetical protein KUCAC02_002654 [Chaenocephalus aceratus]|uniref:Uncharacterized protein n=1 Tax=Chaenocephalus aceratus TaxID=36190 RepID=A0ACB9XUB2_CHAAC|nr:hypothetical protein KUCAC02_002654 [Chaenocephalus aceratus]
MSDKKPRGSDTRPKSGFRSWSADSYVWRGKKRSRSSRNGSSPGGMEVEGTEELGVRSTSCPRRRRERKCSCSTLGEALTSADIDVVCRKALSPPLTATKVSGCCGSVFSSALSPSPSSSSSSPPFIGLLATLLSALLVQTQIHVSELMQEKCPFSPKSELARCWHLIKNQATNQNALMDMETPLKPNVSTSSTSPPTTPLSWDDICCSPGPGGTSLEDWDPSCSHGEAEGSCGHTDYILAEELLEGKPEGTFLLRDSAQDEFLFSVSFRRYSRSLHARIEQNDKRFSFDVRDPCMYRDPSVTGLLRHYSDPATCLFFEPLLSRPLPRTFPFTLQHLCRTVICSHITYQGIDNLMLPYQLRDFLRQYHIKCDGACAV